MAVKTSHMERNYVPVTLCISIGLCSGNMQFSTSLSSETTRPILMKLETYNYRPRTTHHDKRHFDVTTWVVSANSQLPTVMFRYLSFFGLFVTLSGRTGGPILTICESYDVFPLKSVPLGVLLISHPHFGGRE